MNRESYRNDGGYAHHISKSTYLQVRNAPDAAVPELLRPARANAPHRLELQQRVRVRLLLENIWVWFLLSYARRV